MLNYVTSSFVTLALVIDPIGLAPAFIAITQGLDVAQKRVLAVRASFIAGVILIVTALLGNWFLAQLRIGLSAFQISGGILLFSVATRMIFGERMRQESREAETAAREKVADLAAFPLAIPLIAGPGAITATLLLASRTGGDPLWLLALVLIILVVAIASAISFLLAGQLARILGRTGNIVLARLLGILLAAFATQFVVDGIKDAFHFAD
ncbi:MarC family protein [Bradyrhizobium sp. ARR65]|uniref:MarC family protein n=1 Tax=Bradyrhizobium sp. ARR65 TaxID=1040989 RepID=UPI000465D1CD|nr:MarC family protein [Bradyrhizobium sp. ARR65]